MEASQQRQQQLPVSRSAAATTATGTRLTEEEAFNSLRQAAMGMFKQRTKDLTRLAEVDAQSQSLEQELQQAQIATTQLAAQQASLEALVEEEQQRTRQREGRLASLHGCLVQLAEEQRNGRHLQKSAEAAISNAVAFIADFTNADGRLFQLLAQAKGRTAGRGARELQQVAAQVQQALTEATEQQQRLCQGPQEVAWEKQIQLSEENKAAPVDLEDVVMAQMTTAVRLWSAAKENWRAHGELAGVLDALDGLTRCVTDAGDDVAVLCEPTQTEKGNSNLAPLRLPAAPEGSLGDSRFFGLPTAPTAHMDSSGGETKASNAPSPSSEGIADVREMEIRCLVDSAILNPLGQLTAFFHHLHAACAAAHIVLPADSPTLLSSVQSAMADWTALLAERHALMSLVAQTRAEGNDATVAAQEQATAENVVANVHAQHRQLCTLHQQRKEELQMRKEAELENYIQAWRKAWNAIAAQRASLTVLEAAVAQKRTEATEAVEKTQEEMQTHAQVIEAQQRLLSESAWHLQAAEATLTEVSAMKSARATEVAEAQQTEVAVRQQLDIALTALRMQTQEMVVEGDASVLFTAEMAETSPAPSMAVLLAPFSTCPEVCKAQASMMDAGLAQMTEEGQLIDLFTKVAVQDVGATPEDRFRATLQQMATALQLPVELFAVDVVDSTLQDSLPPLEMLLAREKAVMAASEIHRTFMVEAEAEMCLLRKELEAQRE